MTYAKPPVFHWLALSNWYETRIERGSRHRPQGKDCPLAEWLPQGEGFLEDHKEVLYTELSPLTCLLTAVQVLGLLSAWLVRLFEGSSSQHRYHWLFLSLLAVVGISTLWMLAIEPGGWFLSGTTLSLMTLAATCEFRRTREDDMERAF